MPAPAAHDSFPIVAIGASAGGLEALEQFLSHVPAGSGMAFVVIQHLDPTHRGIMPELLQRVTGMEVLQVRDRTLVRPDCVHVIPSNKDMSILHGVLHLLEPAAPRGLRLPIDFFLRSLAQDQQEQSVGVILSGMGSDGTLGLRAIKEKGGLVVVQDPVTAKFDGMPRRAIEAGLADMVGPADELPGRIIAYLQRPPPLDKPEAVLEAKTQSALEKAVILLRGHTGHDFSAYKRSSLYRRIERRMAIHQIPKIAGYVRYLRENSQELNLLFKELLIGVTSFFRDATAWEALRDQGLAPMLAKCPLGRTLRAWVPACATGEEAYSLAIVFQEAVERLKSKANLSLQVFATDLDQDAIDKARTAVFPDNIVADVTPERLARFFVKEDRGYRVQERIREMVIFAPQNLIMDPPFTKLDLLCCRNLLIYLEPEMQKKLIPLFHYSLNPGGLLLLGLAETIGGAAELFATINGKARLFRRREHAVRREGYDPLVSCGALPPGRAKSRAEPKQAPSLQALADQLVLQRYSPPSVLVNDNGDVLYISGRTGKYLEPAAGKANWNILAMARDGVRDALTAAFPKALRQQRQVTLHGLRVQTDGGEQYLDVTLQHLDEAGPLLGLVMIVFREVPAPVTDKLASPPSRMLAPGPRLAQLERDVRAARQDAQSTREEMQASQEELRSANEELQSTNEELQSTNEELTTSKEEMQSLNEELQTLNAQLQAKVDELTRAESDMKNLLNSTDIATVFLDGELKVRRFTTRATRIIKLIPGDVGRPITDLVLGVRYPELADDARGVLQTLVPKERSAVAEDGTWFTVRLIPYRTLDNRIEGLVITFIDITAAKTIETSLQDRLAQLEGRVGNGGGEACTPGTT